MHLFQILLQAHQSLLLRCETKSNVLCLFSLQSTKSKATFHTLMNALILHQHRFSYIYKLIFNQDLSKCVKVRSTIWYFHFLTTQYNDLRSTEHFKVNKEFVGWLTMKLRYLLENNLTHDIVSSTCQFVLHALFTSLLMEQHASNVTKCSLLSSLHSIWFVYVINMVLKNQIK